MSPTVSPARAEEFAAALQLIFQVRPAADALRALDEGTLNPSGLLVVRDEIGVAAATLAAMLPDGGAVVWPPRTRPGAVDVTDLLAGHVVIWLPQYRRQDGHLGLAEASGVEGHWIKILPKR